MKLQDVIQLVENPPENVAEITWELNSTVEDRGLEFLGNLSVDERAMFHSLILSSIQTSFEMRLEGTGEAIGRALDTSVMKRILEIAIKMSIGYALNELEK